MKTQLSPAANLCTYFLDFIASSQSLEQFEDTLPYFVTDFGSKQKSRVPGHSCVFTIAHRLLTKFWWGRNFHRALQPPHALLTVAVANVRVLAQGTNTGPYFKVEELSVYIYKMNSKNDFLI